MLVRELHSIGKVESMLAKKKPQEAVRCLEVGLARDESQVQAAQRLRWRIFGLEMGAELDVNSEGLDTDRFDAFCDHLVVHDRETGELVGTTRLLSQENATRAGRFYSATEFDLEPLLRYRSGVLEIGRTCIHPDYRSGAAIATLWTGLAPILVEKSEDANIDQQRQLAVQTFLAQHGLELPPESVIVGYPEALGLHGEEAEGLAGSLLRGSRGQTGRSITPFSGFRGGFRGGLDGGFNSF